MAESTAMTVRTGVLRFDAKVNGAHCAERECRSNICLNGGSCRVDEVTRSFKCYCPNNFVGALCQDACQLTCAHGTCTAGKDGKHVCQCEEGWSGALCDSNSAESVSCEEDDDCADGERCQMNIDGSKMCTRDVCFGQPCKNNATCVPLGSDLRCECHDGWGGMLCEADVNECEANPCNNGGTCINLEGSFECLCPERFQGPKCEGSTVACTPNPCQNNGTCVEARDTTHCLCREGFSGEFCEQEKKQSKCHCENPKHVCAWKMGEKLCQCPHGTEGENCLPVSSCANAPCKNGGHCLEKGTASFECLCLPKWSGRTCEDEVECLVNGQSCQNNGRCIRGLVLNHCECPPNFNGTLCENTTEDGVDPCVEKPCANGGTCITSGASSSCLCPPGFTGPSCTALETVDACTPNPCFNGGHCKPVGDPSEGGYECVCPLGFEGNFCENESMDVDEITVLPTTAEVVEATKTTTIQVVPQTDNSSEHEQQATTSAVFSQLGTNSCNGCIHAKHCVENEENALCVCEDGYTGSNCERLGNVCDDVMCPPHQQCHANINSTHVQSKCLCETGMSGAQCNDVTSSSFGANSIFIYQSPSVMIGSASGALPYSLSFHLRTTVPKVHIVTGENIFGQRLFSLSLADGKIAVNISDTMFVNLLQVPLNDGNWHKIELRKTDSDIYLSITSSSGYHLLSKYLPRSATFDVFSTRIGKISEHEYLVGCTADIKVDGAAIDPLSSSRAMNVEKGCARTEQCLSMVCQNGGHCVDLWNSAACECTTPFLAPNCLHSLPPSTFGHQNVASFAEINVPGEIATSLRSQTTIQFILRTNRESGSILYVGDSNDADVATFISVEVKDGKINVRSRTGGRAPHELQSHQRVDDNSDHVVLIQRQQRSVKLYIDDFLQSEGAIPARFDHPLFVDKVQLASNRDLPTEAFSTSNYYKGSLQDVRINGQSIVLHQPTFDVDSIGRVVQLDNVLEGMISDDICSTLSRCHQGMCQNTFNDYECICTKGYYGRNCDKKDYCSSTPCSNDARCANVEGGYICVSPVSFMDKSVASFATTLPTNISSISFAIRTHSDAGHIATIDTDNSSFALSLSGGQIAISSAYSALPFLIRKALNIGAWRYVSIQGTTVKIDDHSYGIPFPLSLATISLQFGRTASLPSFVGCLDNVTIGELPVLSFFSADDSKIPSDIMHWQVRERRRIATKCLSTPQCGAASPCLHNGKCTDMWNKHACECPNGFSGTNCESRVDVCVNVDCGHGYCTGGLGVARCICNSGFTGEGCDVADDVCSLLPCKNGGVCENTNGTYACSCQDGWNGRNCTIAGPLSCERNPCANGAACQQLGTSSVSCSCPIGYIGQFCEEPVDFCAEHPCDHGVCHSNENGFSCDCESGYTGQVCDTISNLCTEDSCSGHGKCSPLWNETLCQCEKSYRGAHCAAEVDACMTIPCENDGVCMAAKNGEFTCKCRKYYLGDRCEVEGTCLSNPCSHGECIQTNFDQHSCSCHKGYEGPACDVKIDYCKRNNCRNGATCESLLGEYKCHCIPGFTGENCEIDIDECAQGYCSNGTTCRDRVADYECMCDGTGFTGKNCTEDVNECQLRESCIHGTCMNTNGGYKCACERGFVGRRCSMPNPCLADAMNRTTHSCVHGACVNPIVKIENGREVTMHECQCDRGYTGPQCTTQVEERKALALSYILGPLVAVLLVLCLLGCTLFLFVLKGKRALHGQYSPSHQEMAGARMQMNTMMKRPPDERLI